MYVPAQLQRSGSVSRGTALSTSAANPLFPGAPHTLLQIRGLHTRVGRVAAASGKMDVATLVGITETDPVDNTEVDSCRAILSSLRSKGLLNDPTARKTGMAHCEIRWKPIIMI